MLSHLYNSGLLVPGYYRLLAMAQMMEDLKALEYEEEEDEPP